MTAQAVPRIRLWVIWVVGLAAYIVGVMQQAAEGVRVPPLREVLARRRR